MKPRVIRWLALSFLLLPVLVMSAYANSISLGTAGSYAVLAGSAVTNTGSTRPHWKSRRQPRVRSLRRGNPDSEWNDQLM
jgi:hypothetical protein